MTRPPPDDMTECSNCGCTLSRAAVVAYNARSTVEGGDTIRLRCTSCGAATTTCALCMGFGRYQTDSTDEWVACYNCTRS